MGQVLIPTKPYVDRGTRINAMVEMLLSSPSMGGPLADTIKSVAGMVTRVLLRQPETPEEIGASFHPDAVMAPLETVAKAAAAPVAAARRIANPIKAYHGGPHDFDQFDISKIGTGEGAQAYGHGLYFAENEAVAKDYRNRLTDATAPVNEVLHRGQPVAKGTPEEHAAKLLADSGADKRELMAWARRTAKEAESGKDLGMEGTGKKAGMTGREYYQRLHDFMAGTSKRDVKVTRGRMYEVNIHAEPDELLDWDAPLNKQSEKVRAALERAGVKPDPVSWNWQPYQVTADDVAAKRIAPSMKAGDWTAVQRDATGKVQYHAGRAFSSEAEAAENAAKRQNGLSASPRDRGETMYRDLQSAKGNRSGATDTLREAGIQGIKYFDGASRSSGAGSRNVVVFDDKLIEILRKYGVIPPLAAAPLLDREALMPAHTPQPKKPATLSPQALEALRKLVPPMPSHRSTR